MRPDAEVEPHLADHLLLLRKRNQRPRSIQERRLAVLRVARRFGHSVADVTRAELVAWQDARLEELQPTGMHNEIVHVGQYLKWLHETGINADNPSVVLIRPQKLHQGKPTPMPDTDIVRALLGAGQPLHAWIGLGAFCGLRCMEIAKLAREDIIEAASPYLRITGKGGKERIVPLPVTLRDELAAFNPTGHLFDRMDGKPGPPSAMRVSERLNDYLHSIGVALTAHKMRHRYGTEMYRICHDPFYVAEVMGHASIDTTRGYVALVNDKAALYAEQISNLGAA